MIIQQTALLHQSSFPTTYYNQSSNTFPLQSLIYTTIILSVASLSHYMILITEIHSLPIYVSSLEQPYLKTPQNILFTRAYNLFTYSP